MSNQTPKELATALARDPLRLCKRILPHGKLLGGEWCVGSLNGEEGQSLKVRCSGERAGVWADFAGDEKGDLLDLIAAREKVSLGKAMAWARDFLGMPVFTSVVPAKTYRPLARPKNVAAVKTGPVEEYLTTKRLLTPETIKAYRVAEHGREIAFPSFSPEAELLNIKYIAIDRDEKGKKIVRQEAGCPPALFGWQAIPEGQREAIITEGQIDAMTWFQMGYPALSVPDGVANIDGWIDYEWDNLQRFDTIYISFDNDKPGQEAVAKVAERLGKARCISVVLKQKDANDALQSGATQLDFARAAIHGKHFSPVEIKTPADFLDGLLNKFYPPEGTPLGFFPELFGKKIGLRPGEVTIWTGISSHGKSAILSQVMLEAIEMNQKVAIASMEMTGVQTLYRMTCQKCNHPLPLREVIAETNKWMSGKVWIFDVLGNVETKKLAELMAYSHARYGVHHFVIDSLMKVAVGSEDYDGQRNFLNSLTSFAQRTGSHVHLVAHARKGKDESISPGKMDISGSGNIINQADNILSVWRNKDKEIKVREDKMTEEQAAEHPDTKVCCMKQRENGIEFELPFKFTAPTYLFRRHF